MEHWTLDANWSTNHKSYCGGRWTWPTPLQCWLGGRQVQVHLSYASVYLPPSSSTLRSTRGTWEESVVGTSCNFSSSPPPPAVGLIPKFFWALINTFYFHQVQLRITGALWPHCNALESCFCFVFDLHSNKFVVVVKDEEMKDEEMKDE